MMRRGIARSGAWPALAGVLLLGGCSGSVDNSRVRVLVMEDQPSEYKVGALPLKTGPALLRAAVAQGLVSFGSDGEIRPALAERWIITDDGLSYIFRLSDARWNDGSDITARNVANALKRRLRELAKSHFSSDLSAIKEIVPMTGHVIEVRLTELRPSLLNTLAQPEFGLIHEGAGSGPLKALSIEHVMQLQHRYIAANGEESLVEPIVAIADAKPAKAMVLFANNQSDLVVNGRFQNLVMLNESGINGAQIAFDPVTGLFGLQVLHDDGFLSEPGNREAIAMAIDRPKMLTSFEIVVWRESTTISPIELQNRARIGRPMWTQLDNPARQAEALKRVNSWKANHGPIQPLRIALPIGDGSRVLFANLQADLARVGLEARRVQIGSTADLMLVDEVSDFDSPLWYLSRLSCSRTDVCSKEADDLVSEAKQATNMAQRMEKLGEAEKILTRYSSYIPIAMPVRFSLVRQRLKGFEPNYRGWHLLQFLGDTPN